MSNRYSSPSDHFLSKATSAGPWQRPHMASDNASLPSLRHSSYITRPKTSGKRRHRWAKSQSSYDDDDNHHHEGITMSQDLPRYAHNKIYRKSTVARTSFTSRLLLLIAKQARQRWLIALIGLLLLVLALLYKRAAWIPSGDMLEEDKSSSIRIPPSVADQVAMLDLNPRPISRAPSGRKDEKYMAYFPHSVSSLLQSTVETIISSVSKSFFGFAHAGLPQSTHLPRECPSSGQNAQPYFTSSTSMARPFNPLHLIR